MRITQGNFTCCCLIQKQGCLWVWSLRWFNKLPPWFPYVSVTWLTGRRSPIQPIRLHWWRWIQAWTAQRNWSILPRACMLWRKSWRYRFVACRCRSIQIIFKSQWVHLEVRLPLIRVSWILTELGVRMFFEYRCCSRFRRCWGLFNIFRQILHSSQNCWRRSR